MKERELKLAGLAALVLLLAAFGRLLVPAHLTSLWMDREFTDWVSPIANRLHGGTRLYTDGTHFPMPPLPYVLVRLLHPEGAVWIQENLLNYLFQGATLLVLYFLLAKRVGVGAALAVTMAAVPLFLTLPKTILYDSMAQFMVVVSAGVCASWVDPCRHLPGNEAAPVTWWSLGQGTALGLLTLCKQSTGMGTVLGVCVALSFLPAGASWKQRIANVSMVLVFSAGTVCIVGLALSSFISFPGMIQDVFLTGSEPKGGARSMLVNLANDGGSILLAAAVVAPYLISLSWVASRKLSWRTLSGDLESWLDFPKSAAAVDSKGQTRVVLAVIIASTLGALAAWVLPDPYANHPFRGDSQRIYIIVNVLDFGLVAGLILPLAAGLQIRYGITNRLAANPLLACAVIFLAAAIFHNLSVHEFRWVYDNNPLIAVALSFLLSPLVAAQGMTRRWVRITGMVFLCACIVGAWTAVSQQLKAAATCTEAWPEIRQLAGARLRPECAGMRELVAAVRTQANPANHDAVLLLPNDPNVEAWFERDRPALSSAIIFTDQYWDRYVDRDFAALVANPPKVIVIGPHGFWRLFSRVWHPAENEGLIRLIDLVQSRLLPAHYELWREQPIIFENVRDHMDVYVRRD